MYGPWVFYSIKYGSAKFSLRENRPKQKSNKGARRADTNLFKYQPTESNNKFVYKQSSRFSPKTPWGFGFFSNKCIHRIETQVKNLMLERIELSHLAYETSALTN